ncbi:MARVEL domain-containing protein 3-like isoform X2 [Pelodiscus sinensis]|uniref:MARVEL domain-containing protein 3-like isoform X2 n=1 Tax=Pelodiscus sinensis TaxID=13735 RepID=UPI003F6C4C13
MTQPSFEKTGHVAMLSSGKMVVPQLQLRRLFQQEETHDRNKMSHAERPHHDNQYQYHDSHRSDRHQEERRAKKPHPSNGRSTQGTPGNQHSRPSTAYSDPYQKNIAITHEYVSYPPHLNPQKETFSEKCNKLCTRRGVLKFVEITVNILVLICVGASHAAIAGYSSMGGLGMGSFNINSFYSPFEGSEFQEVRDLDMQYSQMRAPCVYGGVAYSLTLTTLTLLFLIVGAKPIHRVSVRMLVAECVFDALACMGYIVAVGLYLHFIIQVNSTDTCKKRERLYARRGYTWMNCEVQGGDAAVSLFGIIAACLYFASSVVCALAVRTVQAFRRQMTRTQYSPENSYREREHQKNYRSRESIHNTQTIATLV